MSDETIHLCGYTGLNPSEASKAAEWIISLDEGYYELFMLDKENLLANIKKLMFSAESEFGPTMYAWRKNVLAGLVAWFPSSEIFSRRVFVLRCLMHAAGQPLVVRERIKLFDGPKREVPSDGLYLSKFFVDTEHRGTGFAPILFQKYLDAGYMFSKNLYLHVLSNNLAAIRLYTRFGFNVVEDESIVCNNYYLMERRVC